MKSELLVKPFAGGEAEGVYVSDWKPTAWHGRNQLQAKIEGRHVEILVVSQNALGRLISFIAEKLHLHVMIGISARKIDAYESASTEGLKDRIVTILNSNDVNVEPSPEPFFSLAAQRLAELQKSSKVQAERMKTFIQSCQGELEGDSQNEAQRLFDESAKIAKQIFETGEIVASDLELREVAIRFNEDVKAYPEELQKEWRSFIKTWVDEELKVNTMDDVERQSQSLEGMITSLKAKIQNN